MQHDEIVLSHGIDVADLSGTFDGTEGNVSITNEISSYAPPDGTVEISLMGDMTGGKAVEGQDGLYEQTYIASWGDEV